VPHVNDEYRAARRHQILAAARRCFARNGFHQTSMDDLLAEAKLSAGGLYRYFSSKEEIIAAIAEETIGIVGIEVARVVGEDPPPPLEAALRRILTGIDHECRPGGTGGLGVQVWGEAQRNPALADRVRTAFGGLRGHVTVLARNAAANGQLPADADIDAVGQVLFSLLPGYLLQRLFLGDVSVDRHIAGLSALIAAVPTTEYAPGA
jgi:AcrR family transcriptional regulator